MKLISTSLTVLILTMAASIYANPGVNCTSQNDSETLCFNQDEISALIVSTIIMTLIFTVFIIGLLFIASFIFKKMFNHDIRNTIIIIINSIILTIIYEYVKNNYY